MSNNLSESGTVHLRAILNAALESPNGIRLVGITHARAVHIRGMLHAIRSVDRKKSKKLYPDPADPNYGRSAYDSLITEITPASNEAGYASEDEGVQHVNLRVVRSDVAANDINIVDDKTGEAIDLTEFRE